MIPKHKPGRSESYLEYIRSRPCCVCQTKPTEPHHTVCGGVGLKGSDFAAIPMCRKHHREIEDRGVDTFQRENQINISTVVATHTIAWLDLNYADKEV